MATSTSNSDLTALEDRLGYTFADRELLKLALTHKSYAKRNNERLEFVGDAVLGYLVGVLLYRRHTDLQEDALSLMRASLVRGTTLAELARELDLAPHLLLGSGERKSGGRSRGSILADALEAVIGAVHEDGGIEACLQILERLLGERLDVPDVEDLKDSKTRLQERLQGRGHALPAYRVAEVSGADHARSYTVICSVDALGIECSAEASSRRKAEKAAAAKVMAALEARDTDAQPE